MGFQWLGFPWLGYTVTTLAGWLVYTELHCDYTGPHCEYTGWATLGFHWLGYTGLHWLGYTGHFSFFVQWLGCFVMSVQMASHQDSGPTYGVKTIRELPKLLPPMPPMLLPTKVPVCLSYDAVSTMCFRL